MIRPRIIVADDQALVAEGLRSLLARDYDVVGLVNNGLTLIRSVRTLKPDVVIIDVSMRLLNGIDAARQLRKMLPKPKFVFIASNLLHGPAAAAIEQGSCAYLLKDCASGELLEAISSVLKGKSYVTSQISDQLRADWEQDPSFTDSTPDLTDKQREVLQLLAEGSTMKEAGRLLNVSERTIAFHKYKMMKNYHLRNNAELVQFAMKQHVIPMPVDDAKTA